MTLEGLKYLLLGGLGALLLGVVGTRIDAALERRQRDRYRRQR